MEATRSYETFVTNRYYLDFRSKLCFRPLFHTPSATIIITNNLILFWIRGEFVSTSLPQGSLLCVAGTQINPLNLLKHDVHLNNRGYSKEFEEFSSSPVAEVSSPAYF